MSVRQFRKARSKFRSNRRIRGARRLQPHGLIQNLDGLIVFTTIFEHFAESRGSLHDIRVIRRQVPFAHRQAIAHEPLGVIQLRLIGPQQSERYQALGHFAAIGAEN